MIKVLKKLSLYASLLLFTVVAVLLTGCQQQNSSATPIDTPIDNTTTIDTPTNNTTSKDPSIDDSTKPTEPPTDSASPEVLSTDYFQKIVDYILEEGSKSKNSAYSTVEYKVYSNRNSDLAEEDEEYSKITYFEKTDSLLLECSFKSDRISTTKVSLVIPHQRNYTNHQYTYTVSYSYTNDHKQDITMNGSFSAIDTGRLVDVPRFNLQFNHMPDTARVTHFYYSIPNTVNEAEWMLNHIFRQVLQREDKNITYKEYFRLPTFNNPLEIKPSTIVKI